jgi:hypothetical protein
VDPTPPNAGLGAPPPSYAASAVISPPAEPWRWYIDRDASPAEFLRIGHSILTLVVGLAGGVLARFLFVRGTRRAEERRADDGQTAAAAAPGAAAAGGSAAGASAFE